MFTSITLDRSDITWVVFIYTSLIYADESLLSRAFSIGPDLHLVDLKFNGSQDSSG